ncbi:MAG: trypsin-like peptidase domain-containing protein [Desulfovibrionaceae bacterium]
MKIDEKLVSKFFSLRTRASVAEFLNTTDAELVRILYSKPLSTSYTTFFIPKKHGPLRRIDAPKLWLKQIQRRLCDVLSMIYEPKSSVTAYVKDGGIVFNAARHVGKKWVLNIDLENFFPSINFGRVRGMFMAKPYELPHQIASILAQICCYNNALPQGAPTSPIVSNMICAKMDTALYHLAKSRGCIYSRYADDITFSTHSRQFPCGLAEVSRLDSELSMTPGSALVETIQCNGFQINTSKVRICAKGSRQTVTGLVVNEKINCRRSYIKTLRGQINALEKYGDKAEQHYVKIREQKTSRPFRERGTLLQHLTGKLAYIKMLKGPYDSIYRKLKHRLDLVTGKDSVVYNTIEEEIGAGLWIIECLSDDSCEQGTGFLVEGIGLVTCAHVLKDGSYAYRYNKTTEHYSLCVVAVDENRDLAILKFNDIDTINMYKFRIRSNENINIGDNVILAGFPEYAPGATPAIENTTITAFRPRHGVQKIQISATIFHGNSGGPLLDKNLRVVGIADRGAEETVNTAIHLNELLKMSSNLDQTI